MFCVCLVYRELRILVQATHTLGTPNCVAHGETEPRKGEVQLLGAERAALAAGHREEETAQKKERS